MFDIIIQFPNQLINYIKEMLLTNQIAGGGFVIVLMSAMITYIYKTWAPLKEWVKRRLVITIDVQSNDDMFLWLSAWLAQSDYGKRSRLLTVTTGTPRISDEYIRSNEKSRPRIILSPAPGSHFFSYRGRPAIFSRNREKIANTSGRGNFMNLHEEYTVTIFSRNRSLAQKMMEEARDYVYSINSQKTTVRINSSFGYWKRFGTLPKRNIDSIIMKKGVIETIISDLKEFISSEKWYVEMGIPYKRAALFHGPPGTGKTSLARGIAGVMDMDLYNIIISGRMDDSEFVSLVSDIPERSLLLLEDIDTISDKREDTLEEEDNNKEIQDKSEDKKDEKKNPIRLQTVLNAIDGVLTPYGTIIIMTTNRYHRLDSALVRPGRVDIDLNIDYADQDQIKRMFNRFYKSSNGKADKFTKLLGTSPITTSALQEHFVKRRYDEDLAIKDVGKIRRV